jgi:hypothetical protein
MNHCPYLFFFFFGLIPATTCCPVKSLICSPVSLWEALGHYWWGTAIWRWHLWV